MWIVRRLIALGASVPDLLKVLRCQVLSVLQFAVPAWTTMISKAESRSIEAVQKTGLYLIYGARYRSYNWALKESTMKTQVEQRNSIFEKFTKSCIRSKKFSKGFCRADSSNVMTTRSKKQQFKPVLATREILVGMVMRVTPGHWKFRIAMYTISGKFKQK